jgi:predicted RNA-binding Zn-ribbon protein involved in translation (DUF1610 family)
MIQEKCPSCGEVLQDQGRVMDYYDDYSPYMPIDQLKLEDGIPNDYQDKQCPHVFHCPSCGKEEVRLIEE